MDLPRYLRFNAVGTGGFVVQLAVVWALSRLTISVGATWRLAAITALAVEAAILHNFFWHERWTWADRTGGAGFQAGRRVSRLVRFHVTNGLVSLVGNVGLVTLLAGLHPVAANTVAVLICSIVNFTAGDRLVFAGSPTPISQSSIIPQSSIGNLR